MFSLDFDYNVLLDIILCEANANTSTINHKGVKKSLKKSYANNCFIYIHLKDFDIFCTLYIGKKIFGFLTITALSFWC